MNTSAFLQDVSRIHELFQKNEQHLNSLSEGISKNNWQRKVLDDILDVLQLDKNEETYFAAATRIGQKKFEALDIYLEKIWKTQEERDRAFELSYRFVQEYYEALQWKMIEDIYSESLLTDFYRTIFLYTHKLGKCYSRLFLKWNRKLLFETNRQLEKQFHGDHDAVMDYLAENQLFDPWHYGLTADRSYSILTLEENSYVSLSYKEHFPEDISEISALYDEFIEQLDKLDDTVFDRKSAYREYFSSIKNALSETHTHLLVEKWAEVDRKWMAIDTPVQPGHPIEYYEDRYRRAVSIEFDMRLLDPSLFRSQVSADVLHMYEWMYDEIGRENFPESYEYSLKNQQKVQLYISAPVLAYGSFLCWAYSAQVVPNDDEVSKVYGKKIFAFPKYVLDSQRSLPKMQIDQEMISAEILQKYYDFLNGSEEEYYQVYDRETIGHEYGHTLWLTPWCEIKIWEKGLFKNIEEFKATAGGLVAYFLKWPSPLDEHILITHLMRSIKMMRYREVEDIIPYYCECLIHLHIFFQSGLISYEWWQICLHMSEENIQALRELYTAVYTQQIFTYLQQMEAGNFLFEYTVREKGVYFPKQEHVRKFVEDFYERYKQIGNSVVSDHCKTAS